MALTLASATDFVETLLADSGNLKWSTTEISFALRMALGEISLAAGQTLTLNGLDGALVTTLPDGLESALISGGAGFCAALRVGARADWESQAQGEPGRLAGWGLARLAEMRRQIKEIYTTEARTHTQRATTSPWGKWADDFGEVNKDE